MESLTSQVERRLEWRRNKVLELSSQGNSQPEIATILQVGVVTINRDLPHLRKQAKDNIKKYIDERLPDVLGKYIQWFTIHLKTPNWKRKMKCQSFLMFTD